MAVVGSQIDGVTNPNTTGTLSPIVSTYYEKVFLERAKYEFVLSEGSQIRSSPANQGRTVNFSRFTPLGIVTTPLGELSNPVTCAISACTISMTLSEYGLTIPCSKLVTLTSIDSNMKETVELAGQNMGETLNRLVRNELDNGTSYYGNNHIVSTFTTGDTMDACDIRIMVQTLEVNKTPAYADGLYVGKTDPISKYNLLGDTTWVNAHVYSDVKDLWAGEMGELYQVRWLLNKDLSSGIEATSTASSSTIRYYTYVHGDNAVGTFNLESDQPKLYILANPVDSSSPAGRASFVSWAGVYACKLLNANWSIAARFALV